MLNAVETAVLDALADDDEAYASIRRTLERDHHANLDKEMILEAVEQLIRQGFVTCIQEYHDPGKGYRWGPAAKYDKRMFDDYWYRLTNAGRQQLRDQ